MLEGTLFACALLAIGLVARARVRFLRRVHIPAAVVGGIIGLCALQIASGVPGRAAEFCLTVAAELRGWPAPLIAVVFAGLLLERPARRGAAESLRRGVRSATFAWFIILGQLIAGLLVYVAAVRPTHPAVPPSFGQLLEVSWAGGHGSSAAMGEVYAALGFPAGRDLAFFLATAGLVYGIVSGLVVVNIALKRGWARARPNPVDSSPETVPGPVHRAESPDDARSMPDVGGLEPLALQVVLLAAAVGVGYGLQKAFTLSATTLLDWAGTPSGKADVGQFVRNVPLFLFTLIGGLIVRQVMTWLRIDGLIHTATIRRLVGVAIEFLVVAAIATIRLDALWAFWLPTTLLVLAGAAWTLFCLLAIAPRLLPRQYWFELGLLNYGFSTANTPQGLMLLRIVDPDLSSGAAEDYALAAPLSAPFIGGGVLTVVVLPIVLQRVPVGWSILGLTATLLALYSLGRLLSRSSS